MKSSAFYLGCAAAIAAVQLSSCAVASTPSASSESVANARYTHAPLAVATTPVPLPKDAKVPRFTGPYAAEMEQAYRQSKSEIQRQILEDSKITAAEFATAQDATVSCLLQVGIVEAWYEPSGALAVRRPGNWSQDQESEAVRLCEELGVQPIAVIYQAQQRNPGHLNESDLMAACLVRMKLAPAGYTGADYLRDTPDNYPFDSNSEAFLQCLKDPQNASPEAR